jgi:GNAT superfamily N-acetyltransferase
VILRRGGAQDVPFMRDMLRHAYYWRADEAFEDEEPLSRYVNGWGREGDTALVALEGPNPSAPRGTGSSRPSTRASATWTTPRRSSRSRWCRAGAGKGTGSTLLKALVERAREDGYGALSLSVEAESPAVELYERHGFEKVDDSDHSWTMQLRL